ncbi:MAG TPA: S16 family serine protease [Alphaproteobacteria bacterium]|nr:S16 family serine protease [Alphaproteobacteria bacterium]
MKSRKVIWVIVLFVGIIVGYILSELVNSYDRENENIIREKLTIPIVVAADEIGIIGNATFNMVSGNGRILFDNNPAIDTDLQYSAIIAVAYAQEYSNKKLNETDIIIDLNLPLDVIGGVSAGAPITVAVAALLQEKQINGSIILTGTINPDGTIGRVGEIREKATAARDAGYDIILVPPGQSRMWRDNITIQEYLNDIIVIREVSNINEALTLMIIE